MKVERPEWEKLNYVTEVKTVIPPINVYGKLDEWFDTHIAPYEFYDPKDAVEVRSNCDRNVWYPVSDTVDVDTHKALLINIEPIKEDSIQDIVRDLAEGNYPAAEDMGALDTVIDYFKDRAKKALEREEK